MIEHVIRTADPHIACKEVTASRGKVVRAQPIGALYEQGRVSHAAGLDALEDQMGPMTTGGFMGDGSPDRVDALVWRSNYPAAGQCRFSPQRHCGRSRPQWHRNFRMVTGVWPIRAAGVELAMAGTILDAFVVTFGLDPS